MGEIPRSIKRIGGEVKEKLFGKKFEEKTKEAIPSEKKEEIEKIEKEKRNEMIKGIADIIKREKDTANEDYLKEKVRGAYPNIIKLFEKDVKFVEKAEKNFLKGKLNNKELIWLVKHNFQKKKMEFQWEIVSRTKPDKLVLYLYKKGERKLDEELEEPNAKERDWLKRMKREKVSKKEIAKILREKKAEEETRTEKVEE